MKVINNNDGTFTLVKEIALTEEHIDNLSKAIIDGYAEFRDFDRKEYSRDGKFKLSICMELNNLGLLEDDENAWHFTLVPTILGKQIISSIK
jgi:hypothetical protein